MLTDLNYNDCSQAKDRLFKNSRKMFQYEKSNLISKQSGISLHVIVTHVKVALRCGTKRKNAVECYNCVCVSHHNIMMYRYKGRDVSID